MDVVGIRTAEEGALQLIRWVDGALLIGKCSGPEIPRPVRRSWEPVVQASAQGPTEQPWV